jgi:PspAA-like protein
VIIRLMGEGQYRVDEGALSELNQLDDAASAALDRGDESDLRAQLERLAERVRAVGQPLPDEELHPSDLLVPPSDLSLEEARELFSGEGLIPDLPTR